jgi:uncharacterized alkaline shock family protein YloU
LIIPSAGYISPSGKSHEVQIHDKEVHMKAYCKFLWAIALIAFTAMSLGGLLVSSGILPKIVASGALTAMELNLVVRVVTMVVFALLFVLGIYLPILTWTQKRATVIPLRNPLGEVEISQKAISDFIQRIGKEVEGVEDLRATVHPTDDGINIELSLAAQAQDQIPRLIDELQAVVKKYLQTTVGIENVGEIRVRVHRIT